MKPLDLCFRARGWAVPEFELAEWGERRTPFALCVFVLNEGERIRAQLGRMQALAKQVDLIVADGGSTDGAVVPDVLRRHGVRALLTKRGPGRLSAQMRMALAYALETGYEGVIVMDGNNKDDPSAVPAFCQLLRAGYDHVQGSRYVRGGRAVRTPWSRHLAVKCLHAPLVSLAAGFRYTDTTNGFRAYSRRLLLDERVAPFRDVFGGYELHYYLAIRAARLGFHVCETPVTRAYPRGGTPTKIRGFRGNLSILRTLWRACRHRYDPPESASFAA
ncbi:MAG TPA: glycosyltransferase family 2 protein [Gemmataceae bacterium]|jgi:glycosyltransferase involved in cell wall biosynthesis